MAKKFEIDMTEGRLAPKILSFGIPLMLSGFLQLAFNAADLIVVGRFSGETSLAAVGATGALVTLIINVLLGMGTGTSILVSRYFGAKNERQLLDTVQTTVAIAVGGGIIFGVLAQFLSTPLLRLMGTPDDVLPLSSIYLKIYFAGLPIITLYNFTSAALRAVGDSRRPLFFLTVAGVLNVGMNLFFVIVCGMNVVGVALATVLSQCVSCFLTVRCLIRSKSMCRLELKNFNFSKVQFKEIVRIGLPAGIQGSLFSISNVLIQASVNYFGSMVMAGNSAGANIEGFIYVVLDAMNQAVVAAVSQNMGARKYDRVSRSVRVCILIELIISTVMLAFVLPLRRHLVGIYTSEPEAIDAGCLRLIFVGGLYFVNGIQNMMGGVMRGHGYSILPTVVTLLGICGFRVIWIYTVFEHTHSLIWLYCSYPISWVLTITVQMTCYLLLRSKAYAKNEAAFAQSL